MVARPPGARRRRRERLAEQPGNGEAKVDLKITVRSDVPFSEDVEEYLRKKLEHIEHLCNQEPVGVEAIFFDERYLKVCELLLKLKRKEIFARGEASDLNASIDIAAQKLKIQVEKYFKKKIDEKRRPK
jgi:ribosomal subunit interface protein